MQFTFFVPSAILTCIKGTVSRDFLPFFLQKSILSGPLINRLKCFLIWFQFHGVINLKSPPRCLTHSAVFDSAVFESNYFSILKKNKKIKKNNLKMPTDDVTLASSVLVTYSLQSVIFDSAVC